MALTTGGYSVGTKIGATFSPAAPLPLSYLDPRLFAVNPAAGLLEGIDSGSNLAKNALSSAKDSLVLSTTMQDRPLQIAKEVAQIQNSQAQLGLATAQTEKAQEDIRKERMLNDISQSLAGDMIDTTRQNLHSGAQANILSNIKVSGEIANQPSQQRLTQANAEKAETEAAQGKMNLGITQSLFDSAAPGASPMQLSGVPAPSTGVLADIGKPVPAPQQPVAAPEPSSGLTKPPTPSVGIPGAEEAPQVIRKGSPQYGYDVYNRSYLQQQLQKGYVPVDFKLPNGISLPNTRADGTMQSAWEYNPSKALELQQGGSTGRDLTQRTVLHYGTAPSAKDADEARNAFNSATNVLSALDKYEQQLGQVGKFATPAFAVSDHQRLMQQNKAFIEGELPNLLRFRHGGSGSRAEESADSQLVPDVNAFWEAINHNMAGNATEQKVTQLRSFVMNKVNQGYKEIGLKEPYPNISKENELADRVKQGELKAGDYIFLKGKPLVITQRTLDAVSAAK